MNKIRVLMVDDNIELVGMIKEYFNNHASIEVVEVAYDGQEGIKLIEEKDNYDIILLDLIMPKKDGVSILEELKRKSITKNVIVITSYCASEMMRKVSELGVNYFILKPFELEDLERRIIELLKKQTKKKQLI